MPQSVETECRSLLNSQNILTMLVAESKVAKESTKKLKDKDSQSQTGMERPEGLNHRNPSISHANTGFAATSREGTTLSKLEVAEGVSEEQQVSVVDEENMVEEVDGEMEVKEPALHKSRCDRILRDKVRV